MACSEPLFTEQPRSSFNARKRVAQVAFTVFRAYGAPGQRFFHRTFSWSVTFVCYPIYHAD